VIDIKNNDLPIRPPVKLSEWEQAKGASKYRPLLRKARKIIDEYVDTPIFKEEKLFYIIDLCDELKVDLILGSAEAAEEKAEEIREFVDSWSKVDFGGSDKDLKKLLDLMKKFGK
jgi:hypothetical protein